MTLHTQSDCLPDEPNADGSVKEVMGAVAKAGEANSHRVLARLKADPESASGDENPDDTAESASKSDDEAKANPKRARDPSQDSACGGSETKRARVSGG